MYTVFKSTSNLSSLLGIVLMSGELTACKAGFNKEGISPVTDVPGSGDMILPNHVPVAVEVSAATKVNTLLALTLSATDEDQDDLTFEASSPAHGSVSVVANQLTYTPAAGFYGTDSFTYVANDGKDSSEAATITVAVTRRTIYLRSSGDTSGVEASPLAHVTTAQAAVDAAIAANPSANDPILIDVGSINSGNFGDITLTQNFGEHVAWSGVDSTNSVIGNITANGIVGADGIEDENGTFAVGAAGGNGFNVYINSNYNLRFGAITSMGAAPGAPTSAGAETCDEVRSGAGGTIILSGQAIAGNLTADGGTPSGSAPSCYPGGYAGGHGGTITVGVAAQAGVVSVNSGDCSPNGIVSSGASGGSVHVYGIVSNIFASANNTACVFNGALLESGSGGSVYVYASGTAGTIEANGANVGYDRSGSGGSVTVLGQSSHITANGGYSEFGVAGNGGTVTISGHSGNVTAWGSDSRLGTTGDGGTIIVNVGGVAQNLSANGGWNTGGTANGGNGGSITLYGSAQNISADGGVNYGDGTNPCTGGSGGSVSIYGSAVSVSAVGGGADSSENTGGSGNQGFGGAGGTITIPLGGSVGSIRAHGANGDYGGGNGGIVTVNGTSTTINVSGGNLITAFEGGIAGTHGSVSGTGSMGAITSIDGSVP